MLSKNMLREVVKEQREKLNRTDRGIRRELLSEMTKHVATPQVVAICGMRRAGKSTFMLQVGDLLEADSYYYLNFEDERLASFDVQDFRNLHEILIELYGEQRIFLFDEIQVVVEWERYVRRMSDDHYKFFITGSNASMLSRELGTKLTGRVSYLELYPFSFREYLVYRKIDLSLEDGTSQRAHGSRVMREYLASGGVPLALFYPELDILGDLFNDILYRDVVVRYGLDSPKPIRDLALHLFNNPASLQSFSKLKQLVQVGSVTTIKKYIDYLENGWLFSSVLLFDQSTRRQQLQPKKIVTTDTGFISRFSMNLTNRLGRIFENAVYLELRRKYRSVYYYLTEEDREIDFYLPDEDLFVQVCVDLSDPITKERELSSLRSALTTKPRSRALIITLEAMADLEERDDRISSVSAYQWFGKS
jgi:hypothetical protein